MTLTWTDIQQTQEYQDDFERIGMIAQKAIAIEDEIDTTSPFLFILSHLVTILRYHTNHMPDLKDLDLTPFLSLIQNEVGLGLPLTTTFPLVEFLRENKSWFSHRGAEILYDFIGSLVGSPLEIHYPKELIFRMSDPRSCISGAVSTTGGVKAFDLSKQARIRDGKFWAQYTYIVDVLQAQDIIVLSDLIALLQNVHPAGTKMFLRLQFKFVLDTTGYLPELAGFSEVIRDTFQLKKKFPSFDNFLMISGGRTNGLSMRGGTRFNQNFGDRVIRPVIPDQYLQRMSTSRLMSNYIDNQPNRSFSRLRALPDGTYETLYADNDATVLENVRTNVGLSQYQWGSIKDLTWREIKSAAWNLDRANMRGQWMQEQAFVEFREV
jgi:hypothetical protein